MLIDKLIVDSIRQRFLSKIEINVLFDEIKDNFKMTGHYFNFFCDYIEFVH